MANTENGTYAAAEQYPLHISTPTTTHAVTLLSAGNEGNQSDDVLLDQLERLLKERFDLSTTLIKEMEELILVIDQSLQVETDDKKTKSEHCKYDRSSQSSTSEMSILQEHIRNMEETHCSTNEELQATIQELSDLQAQLDETRNERERYKEEKKMLLDSLCRQSERLYSAKTENINLQKLLHETADDINLPEREKKLIELLKLKCLDVWSKNRLPSIVMQIEIDLKRKPVFCCESQYIQRVYLEKCEIKRRASGNNPVPMSHDCTLVTPTTLRQRDSMG
ncbi:cell division [Homalodisca vitripennis]|nr:cell division [Homalodisca vitripennis]